MEIKTMQVNVKLFANLREYSPNKNPNFTTTLEEGATVEDLLKKLGIPRDVPHLTLINGTHVRGNQALKEDDTI
ncbi:MAG: MoaD/ThiS family protein, partial [Deltaproteobacteria bacterium]|nr:MoaD/ThiS family protein [Deltaproteobacteria bacterium]